MATEEEQMALGTRADAKGESMRELAFRAKRTYVGLDDHSDRVHAAGQRVMVAHAAAIQRLGD